MATAVMPAVNAPHVPREPAQASVQPRGKRVIGHTHEGIGLGTGECGRAGHTRSHAPPSPQRQRKPAVRRVGHQHPLQLRHDAHCVHCADLGPTSVVAARQGSGASPLSRRVSLVSRKGTCTSRSPSVSAFSMVPSALRLVLIAQPFDSDRPTACVECMPGSRCWRDGQGPAGGEARRAAPLDTGRRGARPHVAGCATQVQRHS